VQAVILAAGKGRRLRDPRGRPKCLRKVGGLSLVEHQLAALTQVGISDVVIVVGFEHGQIRESVGASARYVINKRFAETNSMYSFLLSLDLIRDDVIVMNSDLYFHPALLVRLQELDGDALLYDSASGEEDEQMKVRVDHGRLVEMSKVMRSDRVCGENVGMLRLSSTSMRHVADAARAIAAAGGERAWLAAAINQVAVDHPIRCVDVAGWPWVEIDFPEDLARARSEVFPAVAGEMAMESYGLLGVHSMAGCAR
jgi:choline kinase